MGTAAAKPFTAVLERAQTRLRWVVARIPFDVPETWPERRGLRVRGEINGFAFRTALFPNPGGEGKVLVVNKRMQVGAKAKPGSAVEIRLEPDLEERLAQVPLELARALKEDRRLRPWFDKLGFSMRKDIGAWVGQPKSAESRKERAERMAERLLLTLEGEKETPPILRAAFLRQPEAREGWEAMTPVRRRNHLLAVFYYQTAEGRERRVAQLVEEALHGAKRLQNPSD
jgi:uncharacterized protein YdeI (YjbR/CyaY-like superfamily)